MNYTEKAIKIAIESGWRPIMGVGSFPFPCLESNCLDPFFWQALGRGLGWSEYTYHDDYDSDGEKHEVKELFWKFQQHRLLDHIQEGGTIEEYFASLSR